MKIHRFQEFVIMEILEGFRNLASMAEGQTNKSKKQNIPESISSFLFLIISCGCPLFYTAQLNLI